MTLPINPKKNVLVIITDQERSIQHFPDGWEAANLPSMTLLKKNGLTFTNGFCNTCMCSPSRSTFFTGVYPSVHGVTDTLSFGGLYSITEPTLDPSLPNLATMLNKDYEVHYRGKWHLNKGGQNNVHPEKSLMRADIALFGFEGWVPPDAGEDIKPENFGGGYANHDEEYIQQAIDFIENYEAARAAGKKTKPWCLVLSLVNPHDVLSYPSSYNFGYSDPKWFEGDIQLPESFSESLYQNYKPAAQVQLKLAVSTSLGLLESKNAQVGPPEMYQNLTMEQRRELGARHYLNFYGNLMREADRQIGRLLNLFYTSNNGGQAPTELAKETLILRISDHGELGMTHGGLRQKAFNVYQETIKIPIVLSNPVMFSQPYQSATQASLVDMMPTLASVLQVPAPDGLRGKDLSPIVNNPEHGSIGDDTILFTFDDVKAGSVNVASAVNAANRIRCIVTPEWKFARYFHADNSYPTEYEMYHLLEDPNEMHNLGNPNHPRFKDYKEQFAKLEKELLERQNSLLLRDTRQWDMIPIGTIGD